MEKLWFSEKKLGLAEYKFLLVLLLILIILYKFLRRRICNDTVFIIREKKQQGNSSLYENLIKRQEKQQKFLNGRMKKVVQVSTDNQSMKIFFRKIKTASLIIHIVDSYEQMYLQHIVKLSLKIFGEIKNKKDIIQYVIIFNNPNLNHQLEEKNIRERLTKACENFTSPSQIQSNQFQDLQANSLLIQTKKSQKLFSKARILSANLNQDLDIIIQWLALIAA